VIQIPSVRLPHSRTAQFLPGQVERAAVPVCRHLPAHQDPAFRNGQATVLGCIGRQLVGGHPEREGYRGASGTGGPSGRVSFGSEPRPRHLLGGTL
jgi:hypothetical protein